LAAAWAAANAVGSSHYYLRILSGEYVAKVMSRAHVSAADLADGIVLACRVLPGSDLSVAVTGKMKKSVCKPL
jgi:hypothetical protein